MLVNYKKTSIDAKSPISAYQDAAAHDLYAVSVKHTGSYIEYDTGLIFELPPNSVGLICSRSSISNYDLVLCNGIGVLDSDYRGTVKLRFKVVNFSNYTAPKIYEVGDKIGQLMVLKKEPVTMVEVVDVNTTERGEGGFGSSGT